MAHGITAHLVLSAIGDGRCRGLAMARVEGSIRVRSNLIDPVIPLAGPRTNVDRGQQAPSEPDLAARMHIKRYPGMPLTLPILTLEQERSFNSDQRKQQRLPDHAIIPGMDTEAQVARLRASLVGKQGLQGLWANKRLLWIAVVIA